jgi:hypothetical protein
MRETCHIPSIVESGMRWCRVVGPAGLQLKLERSCSCLRSLGVLTRLVSRGLWNVFYTGLGNV